MSKSNQLEQDMLDHFYGLASKTAPAFLYVSLHTSDPGEDGASAEVVGNAYARVQIATGSGAWARSGSVVANIVPVTFGAPTPASWGTLTHFGLWKHATSQTAANFWGGAPLADVRITAVGTGLSFAAGDLTHSED